MNNFLNALSRLAGSSKALVVVAVTIAAFVGLYLGKAQWAEVEGLLKPLLMTWLGAVAVEDAAKHFATPSTAAAAKVATEVAEATVKASMAPPAPPATPPSKL